MHIDCIAAVQKIKFLNRSLAELWTKENAALDYFLRKGGHQHRAHGNQSLKYNILHKEGIGACPSVLQINMFRPSGFMALLRAGKWLLLLLISFLTILYSLLSNIPIKLQRGGNTSRILSLTHFWTWDGWKA